MSRLSRVAIGLAILFTIAAISPAASWAQLTRGSIAGTIRDSSGGIIPGATVTVKSVETSAERVVQTDAQGFFRVAALEPGTYLVTIELAGFSRSEQKDVIVRSASETPVSVALSPASVGETVTVTAESTTVGLNK